MSDASEVVVSVDHVSKKFCRDLKRAMMYASADVLRDTVGIRGSSEQLRPGEFWATNDVSFELNRGDCLGLVGSNGAGKSTLRKMLNGIVLPDKGSIRMKGRVGALSEVGAGFHPMRSGRRISTSTARSSGCGSGRSTASSTRSSSWRGSTPAFWMLPSRATAAGCTSGWGSRWLSTASRRSC